MLLKLLVVIVALFFVKPQYCCNTHLLLSPGHTLLYVVHYLFEFYELYNQLNIDQTMLFHFIHAIELGYDFNNPYHNAIHASDVLLAMNYFLKVGNVRQFLEPKDIMAAIIACAIHDYRHPGVNSSFLISTSIHQFCSISL
jgi:hypothetical protein